LPSKVLRNLCFPFLLDITVVPRETEDNAHAEFWGAGGVRCGGCGNGEWGNSKSVRKVFVGLSSLRDLTTDNKAHAQTFQDGEISLPPFLLVTW